MTERQIPNIVVLGSINMDLVVRCAKLPIPGQTILAESASEFCGGKGANQAVAAALAGGQVSMIGAIGSDGFADRLINNLQQNGIDCDRVSRHDKMASGLAVISVDQAGQNSIMVVPGANGSLTAADVDRSVELIQAADVLLVQLEIPISTACRGIEIARRAGVKVILDPAPAPLSFPEELLSVDLVCPNASEAADLTGMPIDTHDDAAQAAAKLCQMGADCVAITLGEDGTLVHRQGQTKIVSSFPVTAVDTTAAGDAFAGALAVQWAISDDLFGSVRFANAAGAIAASRDGAQASLSTQFEIKTLLETES